MEQEDRLELGVRRAQQAQAPLLRPGVGSLVREDYARVVRLEFERGDDAGARAGDAVWAGEVLRERPERRLVVFRKHALLAPAREREPGLLLRIGQGQMDDVVWIEREIRGALLGRDHVVGRRDDALAGLGVAEGAKRLDDGHFGRA